GYPSGADLSNTQFAAMGLRAAARAGVEVPQEAWCALAARVLDYRRPDGGFGYHAWRDGAGREARGSMTTAGVGVLAICRERLTAADARYGAPCYRPLAERVEQAIAGGLEWMAQRFTVTENPGRGADRVAYYLYGLERMGALVPTRLVGEHDWYREGAQVLVRTQHEQGHWQPLFKRGGVQETSYAV
ncbi:MAG: prenyltransferase, partial [Planctomycetota bacterium]|nr:prenyltransferase [Planctomycetota bacterium]